MYTGVQLTDSEKVAFYFDGDFDVSCCGCWVFDVGLVDGREEEK